MPGVYIPQVNIDQALAQHLKSLRLDKGYSLDDLAERSGVSRASISRVEKQSVSPTAQVLNKLCDALKISLSALLMMVETANAVLIKKDHQIEWTDAKTGFKRRCISPPQNNYKAEVLHCELQSGSEINYDSAPRLNLEHHLIMLSGQLEITINEEQFFLTQGDCLRYKLQSGNRFKVIGDKVASYYLLLVQT